MALQEQAYDLHALETLLGPGRVIADPVALITYEGDASLDRGRPDAVIFPRTTHEVAQIVRWAATQGVPLVARGAGTGLSGGAVAEHGGVILEFSQMARIYDFDEAGRSISAQPGAINLTLDTLVKTKGLYYPPDPSSGRAATLGGNLGENAGGPHCFKYGVTANYVTGLEVVLADGQVLRLGGKALDYPEYDFVGLMTGSEGTLGVITTAHLRLIRNPPAVKTLMAAFDSVEAAGAAVSAVISQGLVPATLEMMDQRMMRIIEEFTHAGLPIEAGAALIVEVDGYPQSVGPQMEAISDILRANDAFNLHLAQTAEERDKIWYGRKSAVGAMSRLAPAYYLVDGTVPRSKLAATLAGVNRICDERGLRVGYVFHAGDGNLHPLILIDNPGDKALVRRVVEAGRDILALCVSYDGSLTGEHGVGIEKRAFMPLMYSPTELAVMREIKDLFDPDERLNPGKIFPPPDAGQTTQSAHVPDVTLEPSSSVLRPSSPDEAAAMLRACAAAGKTVRIRGGGTKSSLLPEADLVVSTEHMRGISVLALEDLYVTVGAGTPLDALQAELATHRVWAPLASPWPAATVGGIVATAFNAPLRMRYGGTRDLLLATTLVLPDGRVIRAGRPVVKNVAGYDLPKLLVGTHGTLGLLADLTLKLAPLPYARETLAAPLPDAAAGLTLGARLLQGCLVGSALLLCGNVTLDPALLPSALHGASSFLLYTAEGVAEDVAAETLQVRELARGAVHTVAPSGSELWAAWLREAAPTDTVVRLGVAPKDLPVVLRGLAPVLGRSPYIADLASGLLYTRGVPLAPLREAAQRVGGYAVVLSAAQGSADAAAVWGRSPDSLALMRALKARWDARGLLNPGAFLV